MTHPHLLRSLIRETLLLEEVYGAQAVVYHGTNADPQDLISAILRDEFEAGKGAGDMYGKGLYTVYDLKGTQTEKGEYGDHVIKLKVNLYGYIIFDPDIARLVYKKPLTPAQQAEEVGYSEAIVKTLGRIRAHQDGDITSGSALDVSAYLSREVKGLVFTGNRDGKVVVVYDPTTVVPMAWKRVLQYGRTVSEPWTPVDKAALLEPRERPDVSDRVGRPVQQSALRRSAMGDFEAGKWNGKHLNILKRLERLPKDQRIVEGDLDLSYTFITTLPEGLRVDGNLSLRNTPITSLPAGLKVGGTLDLRDTRITSLPAGLEVGGHLDFYRTGINFLPSDIQVGGAIYGLGYSYWNSVPRHLMHKLR